jgi:hypothetical protein
VNDDAEGHDCEAGGETGQHRRYGS